MSIRSSVAEGAPARVRFDYHAYISYCDADEPFVEEELLAGLTGLNVMYKRRFEPGVPIAKAREDAVARSRHMVVVLTPQWHESNWESMDIQAGVFQDPSVRDARIIPLLLKTCKLPQALDRLVLADFTQLERRGQEMAKLLTKLGQPKEVIDRAVARSGLRALIQLMQDPKLAAAVAGCEDAFNRASEQISLLNEYKTLHDRFQVAEGAYQLVQQQKALVLVGKAEGWDDLITHVRSLDASLERLVSDAKGGSLPKVQILWAGRIEGARAELLQGADKESLDLVNRALEKLNHEFGSVPGKLNDRMVQTAEHLPLAHVVQKLRLVAVRLAGVTLDDQATELCKEFTTGIDALESLHGSLTDFIEDHNCLQAIDETLRTLTPQPTLQEIRDIWPGLREPMETLGLDGGATWSGQLGVLRAKLDMLLAGVNGTVSAEVDRSGRRLFNDYRFGVIRGFNQLDQDLRRLCRQLEQIGKDLSELLRRMRHEQQ